jgi:hypothetical protein
VSGRVCYDRRLCMRNTVVGVGALALGIVAVAVAVAREGGAGGSAGSGAVFVAKPGQSLRDQKLTDRNDPDAAVPAAAYLEAPAHDLDGSRSTDGAP